MQEVFRGEYNDQAHLPLWSACLPLLDGRQAEHLSATGQSGQVE